MGDSAVHVVFINYSFPAAVTDPDELLVRFEGLAGWADGVVQAGGQASVIQRFGADASLRRNGVQYHFVNDGHGSTLRSWQQPRPANRLAVELCRGAVASGEGAALHLNGLMYGLQARALRRALPQAVPLVMQHHAERPATWPRALAARWGLRSADGFFFTAEEQAAPWIDRGFIQPRQPVFEVVEGSTDFRYGPRDAARRETGLSGDPVWLWVGQLIERKDPLAVLAGFETLLETTPNARLTMAYGPEHPLLPAVRARIAQSTALSAAVHLLGTVPHRALEAVYNSADYFVLGSHSESTGYALAEALACGVVPVVTDIPSFRRLTNGGRIGALWTPGDPTTFAAAAHQALQRSWDEQSRAARAFFDQELSFAAIGRAALAAYTELARGRSA